MLLALISSCKYSCSAGEGKHVKTKTITSDVNTALNGAVIKNDIDIEAQGIKLREAYLLDAENKPLAENVASLEEKIYLVIQTDTGWIKENGKSFIGAGERISTAEGKVIVDATDIFSEYDGTGLPADKAGAITLSARITQVDPGVENFIVKFRVWDKRGNGEIKGTYKFRIRK